MCLLTSLFFSLVCFGTNYYGVDHFDAVVAVNLTAMLVMATLYQTVNNDLPATSSLKMIDIWMLLALAIPFMEVIMHTAMAWIRQRYEFENTKEVVDVGNQTDEIYRKRSMTPTARKAVKVGPLKKVTKRLIKEVVKEAVTAASAAAAAAASATKDDQYQAGEIEIDSKEPKRPIIRKIAWVEKDERTWPKRVLRYFVYYFQV